MAIKWFCKIMGEEWGPLSAQELAAIAHRGRLTRDDPVRRGAEGTWIRAELVCGLFNSPPIAPTVTPDCLLTAVHEATPAKRTITARPAPQYWIKLGLRVAGPFSGRKLRQFAAEGSLRPIHLVSGDRRRWMPAMHLHGLTFGRPFDDAETCSVRSAVSFDDARASSAVPTVTYVAASTGS